MRWDDLFADLGSRLDAAEALDRAELVADLTRTERAAVALVDRLVAQGAGQVTLTLRTAEVLTGRVAEVGAGWLLLAEPPREHLVPLGGVVHVGGLAPFAAPPGGLVRSLGLGRALREIARDRSVVVVAAGAVQLVGRVDAVGSDHLDLALVQPDTARPTGELRAVPFSALDRVTSR